jgi:hypothetical protein
MKQTTVNHQKNIFSKGRVEGVISRNKNVKMPVLHENHSVALKTVTFMELKNRFSCCVYSTTKWIANFM